MILLKSAVELTAFIEKTKASGLSVGFVPTMGALHDGHISLIRRSGKDNRLTVCSIFINPTQFNNPEDFKKYPVTIEKDIDMLEKWGCDVLFLPEVSEIYPTGSPKLHYSIGYLESILEGKYRPGHFQGVCQVVHRLLEIVIPDNLYLGQKDYQQCMVIAKMVALQGFPVNILICPTLRETDGLAMSSRNMRLNAVQRNRAVEIHETLLFVKSGLKPGLLHSLKATATNNLSGAGFTVDYVEIADAGTLELQENWDGEKKLVVLIAAFLDDIRLIDNMVIN